MTALRDLTGKRFGKLKVLRRAKNTERVHWVCLCDCGEQRIVLSTNLVKGNTKSCGCSNFNNPKKIKDLKGKVFGKLTVLSKSKQRSSDDRILWNCLCECGNRVKIRGTSLNYGTTKSCGCLKINNLCGENNYQARRIISQCGTYIPSTDPWAVRAVRIMSYARKDKIPIDFKTVGEFVLYLRSIEPKKCPVFGKKLIAGQGQSHDWSPSVDKIIPSKGYVKGNIQILSYLANKMKQNASPTQLKQFAQWVMKGESNA